MAIEIEHKPIGNEQKTIKFRLHQARNQIHRVFRFVLQWVVFPVLAAVIAFLYTRAYFITPMYYKPDRIEIRIHVPANSGAADPQVILNHSPWQTYNNFKLERKYKLFPEDNASPEVFVFTQNTK